MDQIIKIKLEHSYVKDRCYHNHDDYKDCKEIFQQSINITHLNKSNESFEKPFGCGHSLKFLKKAVCAVNNFYRHGELIFRRNEMHCISPYAVYKGLSVQSC